MITNVDEDYKINADGITISRNGVSITNDTDDFRLDMDGISLRTSAAYSTKTSVTWDNVGGIAGVDDGTAQVMQYRADDHDFMTKDGSNAYLRMLNDNSLRILSEVVNLPNIPIGRASATIGGLYLADGAGYYQLRIKK